MDRLPALQGGYLFHQGGEDGVGLHPRPRAWLKIKNHPAPERLGALADLRLEDVDEFPLDVVVRSVVYPSAAGRFGR